MKTAEAVKERGILMSAPMVRAILDGRKTVTRRVIKPQPAEGSEFARINEAEGWWEVTPLPGFGGCMPNTSRGEVRCPFPVGKRLWVRETWAETEDIDGRPVMTYRAGGSRCIVYPTVGTKAITHGQHRITALVKWRPSLLMPRWASRITLEVTDVRAERVQDITEADAEAEGAFTLDSTLMQDAARSGLARGQKSVGPVDYFRELWDLLNASRGFSWESNPYVWRVEFRVLS